MQYVFVLSATKEVLMPTHPARARVLLHLKKAAVYRKYPFTIILLTRETGDLQNVELKIDPGSKTTGVAIVSEKKISKKLIWAAHLQHRGAQIKDALLSRRGIRRSRRHRKTRYRAARFDNRTRVNGWLPPSLSSRVNNVFNWAKRLLKYIPIKTIAIETVRFDMQKLKNPEIDGIEYSQGTLFGYEVREYILEKYQRTCAYCDKQNILFEVDHIHPRSRGGSNRVDNLILACHACNKKKGNQEIQQYLVQDKTRLNRILASTKKPLKDAAAVNATRYAIGDALKIFNLPIYYSTGAVTKFNRIHQNYAKDHFIDAACVGETGVRVNIPKYLTPLSIVACGRGNRQMCRVDRYGFPRTSAKSQKRIYGFKTGDIVKSIVTGGKKTGNYLGRVAIRATGNFNIKTLTTVVQGIHYRYCKVFHAADGYSYNF